MKNRVVITGMGVKSPVGNSKDAFWKNIQEGKVGIDFISRFDTSDYKVKVAAEIKDFDVTAYIPKKEAKRMDRFVQLAIAASKDAVEDAGLEITSENADHIGIVVGSGIGGLQSIEDASNKLENRGPGRVSPFFIPMAISNMAAGNISIHLGTKGVSHTINTACASSADALGEAFRKIQYGDIDVVIAGGTESSITPVGIAGFQSMTALSESEDPMRASIPFDADRSGFVMGEGAAMLVLESLDHATKRNAKILGEIVGYGATSDAYHITSPSPEAEGGAKAIKMALKDAGVQPEAVGYINAHGTSTPYNDKLETLAIKKAFDAAAHDLYISSTKSMTGHLLGGAGAIESIVCLLALSDGFIPPTMGYEKADPECDLNYVPNKGISADIEYAMTNSLGFGGHNAVLLYKKWVG